MESKWMLIVGGGRLWVMVVVMVTTVGDRFDAAYATRATWVRSVEDP